jgi:hypothetical protein
MSDIVVTTEALQVAATLRERGENPVQVFGAMQVYKGKRSALARVARDHEWAASADAMPEMVERDGRYVVGLVSTHPATTVRRWVLAGLVAVEDVRL